MARILDTIPDFVELARAAFLKDPATRQSLWQERYRARHSEVFAAFFDAGHGDPDQVPAVTHKLTDIRKKAEQAAPVVSSLIEEVEPAVRATLALGDLPEPLHVLMVGTFSTNASVARVDGELAVLHCLEWFEDAETARVLVAHEDTHAWHEAALGQQPPEDPAWTAFSEGLAVQVSRIVVPGRPEDDYFWYGVTGFEEWLPWCRENHEVLMDTFAKALDDEEATDAFFGAGFVEGHWRVGFYVADQIVGHLGLEPPALVRMSVDEARTAIRNGLGTVR